MSQLPQKSNNLRLESVTDRYGTLTRVKLRGQLPYCVLTYLNLTSTSAKQARTTNSL